MTHEQFNVLYATNDKMFFEHMNYIIDHRDDTRAICNGDTLIEAAEDGYLYEAFRDHWIKKNS